MMNARTFFDKFTEDMKEDTPIAILTGFPEYEDEEHTYMDAYREFKPCTELINRQVIPDILKSEGLDVQHEYFRVDVIGYESRYREVSEEESSGHDLYRNYWNLKVAVEHENDKHAWTDEVMKLAHLRCPLKVVISYNYCDRRDPVDGDEIKSAMSDEEKLKFTAEWMQKIDAFDNSGKEEILVIIGNAAGRDKESREYDSFDYRGYIFDYTLKQFVRI